MHLEDVAKSIIHEIQKPNSVNIINNNKALFDIFEGELLPIILEKLRCQLSPQSYKYAKERVAPINVLKRIIDKLSKIYQQNPTREVIDGTDEDKELVSWYEEVLGIDELLNQSNEFMNLQKNNLIELFVDDGTPKIRTYSAHQFWVYSTNKIDPTEPTHILTYDSDHTANMGKSDKLRLYSDDEFSVIDSHGKILVEDMLNLGNPEGLNPYGILPFVYVNQSRNLLIPKPDTDTIEMTTLIPILLTDLNHAVQFQSFSMMYGIDVDVGEIARTPNAFLDLKSDPQSDKNPQIGSIKPDVDIDQVLGLIASEFSLWLNTRGIKPGSIGTLNRDNFASGISKMVDEMDISENRQKQVTIYRNVEKKLWNLLLFHMHPFWVANGMVENRHLFSPSAKVVTNFKPQVPMMNRGTLVKDLADEIASGFTTKKRAIRALNPHMSEEDADELIAEIEQESQIIVNGVTDGLAEDQDRPTE